jgi:hypothetical protein
MNEQAKAHFDKFDIMAHRLSIPALKSIVPFSKEQIVDALAGGDEHLNSLPLHRWDTRNDIVRRWAAENGYKSWSLSYTVCVLKHVAKYYIATGK